MNAGGYPPAAALFAAGLYLLLATPAVRGVLEGSMVLHQTVQIPLLALCGWCAAAVWRERRRLDAIDPGGVSGLMCLVFAVLFWMLPRQLDAAVGDSVWAAVKFVSVPLLIGVPLALSWPRMHPILKGLVKAELFVMLLRLAWLYLDSPVRLCNRYRLDEQQTLAVWLALAAGLWACVEIARFFFGDHLARSPPRELMD